MSKFFSDRNLLLILVGAFLLRFIGMWYGLPSIYNSDESTILTHALSFGAKKSLEPSFVEYPTLYFYFLFFVYGIYFFVGYAAGIFKSALDLGAAFFLDPTGLFLVGRFASVILGTLSVWMVFRLGERFFSRNIALLSSFILALSFTQVNRAHWILVEASLAFMCVFALYLILKHYQNPSIKTNVWAGLVSGLAISTKYNAGFIFVPLLLSSILVYKKDLGSLSKNLSVSLLTLAAGFLIGSPYWIFSFSAFLDASVKFTFSHVTYGVVGHISSIPFVWPFWELVSNDWTVGFLLLAGFIYALFSREKKQVLLLSFAVPTFLYVATWSSADLHYITPIYPALALLAAIFLNDILGHIQKGKVKILFLVLLFLPSFLKIAHYDIGLTQKDTRAFAEEWIESKIPDGSVIGYENYVYGPNLFDPSRFFKNKSESQFLPLELRERLVEASLRRTSYNLFNLRKDIKRRRIAQNIKFKNPYFRYLLLNRLPKLTALPKNGVEYLMISSDSYEHYFKNQPPKKGTPVWLSYQNGRSFYSSVFESQDLSLLKEFNPGFWNPGPTIKIYKFGSAESANSN